MPETGKDLGQIVGQPATRSGPVALRDSGSILTRLVGCAFLPAARRSVLPAIGLIAQLPQRCRKTQFAAFVFLQHPGEVTARSAGEMFGRPGRDQGDGNGSIFAAHGLACAGPEPG